MKTACLFAVISLALSVSAAATVQCNHNNNNGNIREGQENNGSNKGASNPTLVRSTSSVVSGVPSATPVSTANEGPSSPTSTATGSAGEQSSLTLDKRVIATGFENNGQDVPTAGQVPSLTSSNNFINFCLTVPNLPITNGKQITTGSCNPAPMGVIPSNDNMPSAKFVSPANGATIPANKPFTIQMAIQNFQSGNFVNADENYFAAPQHLNGQGQIIGHSHVVVEALTALDQTTPTNPKNFAFFKGLNAAAVNGILTADVTGGLPAGFYKLSSINTAANHQPVLVPVAQHGSLDDAVYFTVSNGGGDAAPGVSSSASAPPAASATAKSSKSTKGKQGKRFHQRSSY